MNPHQSEMLAAFQAWDGVRIGAALIRIAEEVSAAALEEKTIQDLSWSCRELLEDLQLHPHHIMTIEVPEGKFSLVLAVALEATPSSAPMFRFSFNIRPKDYATFERWTDLELSSQDTLIPRDQIKAPFPFKGEAGYSAEPAPRSVGLPDRVICLPSQTYCHALAAKQPHSSSWLDRYLKGECAAVWNEMIDLGERIRNEETIASAILVVRDTMRRCRDNVARLHWQLVEAKYPFADPDEAFVRPPADVLARIAALEQQAGPIPLALAAWCELVGSVNFIPDPESDWSEGYPDPLFFGPVEHVLDYDEDNWRRGSYKIAIAPDDYHKADTSGGPPYEIGLPNAAVDASLENEKHNTTFIDYLRLCFKTGGFPGGLGKTAAQRWAALKPDLLPI